MAEVKASNQKEFESKTGKKYIFQKVKPIVWMDVLDNAEKSGKLKRSDFYPGVLETVVVSPQVKIDDFEDYAELDEVVTAAVRFQQGK